jgi:hypothetical protein
MKRTCLLAAASLTLLPFIVMAQAKAAPLSKANNVDWPIY